MKQWRRGAWIKVRRGCVPPAMALGLLLGGILSRPVSAQPVTCFLGGPPGRPVPACYPDPHDPGRSEVRPDRAALYCEFWAASGTILPCPYSRSAADAARSSDDASVPSDPVDAEIERGNRWRQRRD